MTHAAGSFRSFYHQLSKLSEKLGVIIIRISLKIIEQVIEIFAGTRDANRTREELSKTLLGMSPRVLQLATSINKTAVKCNPYLAAFKIDQILTKIAPSLSKNDTFFIEAGCNDGIKSSNTIYLEAIYGAKGMLVEASASLFERARENRSASNIFEHAALCSPDYNGNSMEFIYCDLMTVSTSSKELDPLQHVIDGHEFSRQHEYRFVAPCKTLDSLVEKHRITQVDLLSLDLEGGEIEALKGADKTLQLTEYLVIESRNPEGLKEVLKKHNFVKIMQFSRLDYLFKNLSFEPI